MKVVVCIFIIEIVEGDVVEDNEVLHVVVRLKVEEQGVVVTVGALGAYGSKDEPYAPLPGRNDNDPYDPCGTCAVGISSIFCVLGF